VGAGKKGIERGEKRGERKYNEAKVK